jgi:hypothetical protein
MAGGRQDGSRGSPRWTASEGASWRWNRDAGSGGVDGNFLAGAQLVFFATSSERVPAVRVVVHHWSELGRPAGGAPEAQGGEGSPISSARHDDAGRSGRETGQQAAYDCSDFDLGLRASDRKCCSSLTAGVRVGVVAMMPRW